MSKTILITASTDGIGKRTAKLLASKGHKLILHGRSASKLKAAASEIDSDTESVVADLSRASDVDALAAEITRRHERLDVLINNAGVLKLQQPSSPEGLDLRFVVNTIAPYVLTQKLLSVIPKTGRIVNVSSAAQAPVDLDALKGGAALDDMSAYAQSKLGIVIWTQEMASQLSQGPIVVAVNPGSLLASKMVKEGFGVAGHDLSIGAKILAQAALDPSFEDASGKYFDNDSHRFTSPHAAARDADHVRQFMEGLAKAIAVWRGGDAAD